MDDRPTTTRPHGTLHLGSCARAKQIEQHLSAGERVRQNPADGKAIALEATRWAAIVAKNFSRLFADGQKSGAYRWAMRTTAPRLAVRRAFYEGKSKQEALDLLIEAWSKQDG
jgi:hypothetical protein